MTTKKTVIIAMLVIGGIAATISMVGMVRDNTELESQNMKSEELSKELSDLKKR